MVFALALCTHAACVERMDRAATPPGSDDVESVWLRRHFRDGEVEVLKTAASLSRDAVDHRPSAGDCAPGTPGRGSWRDLTGGGWSGSLGAPLSPGAAAHQKGVVVHSAPGASFTTVSVTTDDKQGLLATLTTFLAARKVRMTPACAHNVALSHTRTRATPAASCRFYTRLCAPAARWRWTRSSYGAPRPACRSPTTAAPAWRRR